MKRVVVWFDQYAITETRPYRFESPTLTGETRHIGGGGEKVCLGWIGAKALRHLREAELVVDAFQ